MPAQPLAEPAQENRCPARETAGIEKSLIHPCRIRFDLNQYGGWSAGGPPASRCPGRAWKKPLQNCQFGNGDHITRMWREAKALDPRLARREHLA
jgi:hypothetical protein